MKRQKKDSTKKQVWGLGGLEDLVYRAKDKESSSKPGKKRKKLGVEKPIQSKHGLLIGKARRTLITTQRYREQNGKKY